MVVGAYAANALRSDHGVWCLLVSTHLPFDLMVRLQKLSGYFLYYV